MTDKQIIIYKKECYNEPYCSLNKVLEQLSAKEQECEKLKEYFEIAKEASNCNLKALGEITEWADKLDEENDQLKAENDLFKQSHKTEQDRRRAYENALTEIKEIAQFACEKSVCDRNHCDYCSDGQILQKISEVLNE